MHVKNKLLKEGVFMRMKDYKRVIFTPGLSRESLTSDYYAVDNMVIAGATGSGKTTTIQGIVKSIMDNNEPEEYSLMYIDMKGYASNPMCNTNRIIPSMSLMYTMQEDIIRTDYKERAEQFIRHLAMVAQCPSTESENESDLRFNDKFLIVVIENFEHLDSLERNLVFTIMSTCEYIKFILSVQDADAVKDYMELFSYRIATRLTTALASDIILGCNLGYKQADRFGTCWFYYDKVPGIYRKYRVRCVSQPLLNRFMKAQSGYSGPVNRIVKDYNKSMRDAYRLAADFRRSVNSENDAFRAYIDKFLFNHKREGV